MKLMMIHNTRILSPALAGFFLLMLFAAPPATAQYTYSGQVIDLQSPLSQDIMVVLNDYIPTYSLTDIEIITRDVQLAGNTYESVEPSILLALMAAEDIYAGYPQARLYYYNLDTGLYADETDFPPAWIDSERVARSYFVEYQRYEDKTAAIAAYFVGSRNLPPDGDISNQPEGLRDLVGYVLTLDAEWSHLGEGGGPQIIVVEVDEETPETPFEQPDYDMSEVREAYIQNMMYFNSGLTDELSNEIFDAISTHASDYQTVDARLVMALVACESSFRPDAVSHCGAQGLGQLMPFTAEGFGVEDPFDVDENIRATFAYLAREIERWNTSEYPLDRVLAAYNAGPGAVERYSDYPHNGIPPYEETMNYVPKVLNYYFYFLPEDERVDRLNGQTRYFNDLIQLVTN